MCFLARGCSRRPQGLIESIEAGAGGLKIHEDLGAFPEVIDCCLSVAEQMDVAVAIHMDGLNESAELSDTLSAIAGRTVHAYHVEGAGGGPYDLLEIVAQPHVLPSSTNPTFPYTTHTVIEHFEMIMLVHGLNPAFPEDIQAARHRIRPTTMAAETLLHDLGAISIVSSDSLGMGRIGETIRRTWQMAHVMNSNEAQEFPYANQRVLRYLAKYTINPAITHGLIQNVGTLEPGKLADIVIWQPAFFGVKPHMIIKGGMPAWGALGDGNAAIETAQPLIYGPLFGGNGRSAAPLSLTFVSQASLDAHIQRRLQSSRLFQPVQNTRAVRKKDMLFNDQTPKVQVDALTQEVTIQGKKIALEPSGSIPLSRLYVLS